KKSELAKVQQERKQLESQIQAQIEAQNKKELEALNTALEAEKKKQELQSKQFEEMQKQELQLRKKAQELELQQKQSELDMQRKLDEERKKQAEQIEQNMADKQKLLEEQYKLQIAQQEKKMNDMQKSLQEAQQKSQQGSQQLQGDIREIELKELLSRNYPLDLIEDVPTGIRGADLIQTVRSNQGTNVGRIVWESKETKTWSEKWVNKLKDDMAGVQGDIAILVTRAMPEEVEYFGQYNGVWVCEHRYASMLAGVIRSQLDQVALSRQVQSGKDEKMEVLYEYLSGTQFKNRVEGIVSSFVEMQAQLDSEKRVYQRVWAKREKEIERMTQNTLGMYGDMQGIVGNSLSAIESLEMESLVSGDDTSDQERLL
ncbi:MAG: DUF2130 domain-containing protein, partial [Patescibacteria group bacterium]|nr:DUF2130 domain-containing protein [Patescibacteria group bacterium]